MSIPKFSAWNPESTGRREEQKQEGTRDRQAKCLGSLKKSLGKKAENTGIMIIKENYGGLTQQIKQTESQLCPLQLLS